MDPTPAPDTDTDREDLRRIYRQMTAAVAVGVALALLLQVLWPQARGPIAWVAMACGTAAWGVVETAELHLSLGRAMLLFEVGLVCFALAGALILLLGQVIFLVAWGIAVYAFLRALNTAFHQRIAAAQRGRHDPVRPAS